jgi:hypothetical protein
MLSRTSLCPQLQAGEIGIRGYLQIIAPRPAIGTASASLNVWSYPWPRPQRMKNLLIEACHFWSNGVNAFLFGHGSMSPTLADVYMITGLNISGAMYPWEFKGSTRQM